MLETDPKDARVGMGGHGWTCFAIWEDSSPWCVSQSCASFFLFTLGLWLLKPEKVEKNQRTEDGMLAESVPWQGWKSTVFIESPPWSLFSFPFVRLSQPHETLISIVHFQFLKFPLNVLCLLFLSESSHIFVCVKYVLLLIISLMIPKICVIYVRYYLQNILLWV